jgi:putative hydrolase of the HAD superfamily
VPGLVFPKAILFDMDDTLLNSTGKAAECWQTLAERFAPACGGVHPDALCQALVESSRWFWGDPERHRVGRLDMMAARTRVIADALRRYGVDGEDLPREMAKDLRALRDDAMALFPEAIEVLRALQARQIALALVTNGEPSEQRAKIDRFALAHYFATIIVEGEFGIGKPDLQVYRHTLELLGVAPREAWMVGDNLEWDVLGPQRVGMRGIWLDALGAGLPPGISLQPDCIIRSLRELLQDLEQARQSPSLTSTENS